MRREEYERTYGRRGVLPPAPVHEYRRPRSRKKMKCLISLGLILPTLAAVIGVAAWAVSADVAVNDGNRVKVDGSPHLQNDIPLLQNRVDGFNPRFVDGRNSREHHPNDDYDRGHPAPLPYAPPAAPPPEKRPPTEPASVQSEKRSTSSTTTTKAAASSSTPSTNVGDLLSQIISASRGTSNGSPQFVVVAPLLDAKERDELSGRRTSSSSSGGESSSSEESDSDGGRKKNSGPERIDHHHRNSETAPRRRPPHPPGGSTDQTQKVHFSDRIGHSGEVQLTGSSQEFLLPSASGSQEFLLPPLPQEAINVQQPHLAEEPIFIDLTSSGKNVHHTFSAQSVPSFGLSQQVALPAPPHPPSPPKPPPPPPSYQAAPPYQNGNRQQTFYHKPGAPSHHGPKPYAPVRQASGASYGPKPPPPPPPQPPPGGSFFSDLVSGGSGGSNKNDGHQGSNRWGTISHHGGYGHLEPPKGITFSISGNPHGGYQSDYHHSEPLSVVKSIFLPFLPKPRVNLNGRVVFGVVLEKGIGLGGNKPGGHHHHVPPY